MQWKPTFSVFFNLNASTRIGFNLMEFQFYKAIQTHLIKPDYNPVYVGHRQVHRI